MWMPSSLLALFTIDKELVDNLRTDVAVLRAKNDIFEHELISARVNSDWMRLRVNQLEIERAALMSKAYPGLNLPVPEIARVRNKVKDAFDLTSLFEDQGDDETKPNGFAQ